MKHLVLLLIFLHFSILLSEERFVRVEVKKGETIQILFNKWEIPFTNENLLKFKELNSKKVKQDKIFWGVTYRLPILVYSKDDFESSILPIIEDGIYKKILEYNSKIFAKGIYPKKDKILITYDFFKTINISIETQSENKALRESSKFQSTNKRQICEPISKFLNPYYGEKHQKIKYINNSLKGCAFYLISGHGGPDPGAIGKYRNFEMAEDEYSYDITLRLAYELERRRAKVFMITIDTSDGIRDEEFLDSKVNELFYGGMPIPLNQKDRLQVCVDIVNKLYQKHRTKYKKHISINIHLDSRGKSEKIDVFFYYQEQNVESRLIADLLLNTLRKQYEKHQPGRGYSGTVSSRNLFMLRNTLLPTVYIELGNIQNPHNQIRFIKSSNRKAIAKWLTLGLIEYCRKK